MMEFLLILLQVEVAVLQRLGEKLLQHRAVLLKCYVTAAL